MSTESSSTIDRMTYERWEQSNYLSTMLIKAYIDKIIRGLNPECNKVNDYMKAIEEQFVSSDKALANTLMDKLFMIKHHKSRKYVWTHNGNERCCCST